VLSRASAQAPLADAPRYAVKLKPALLVYTEDGRLEIDNNPAENALRGIALGRKNWIFAGADCGGERAADMYSLLETAKLNGVNPQDWLTDVLDRIGEGIRSASSTSCCRGSGQLGQMTSFWTASGPPNYPTSPWPAPYSLEPINLILLETEFKQHSFVTPDCGAEVSGLRRCRVGL